MERPTLEHERHKYTVYGNIVQYQYTDVSLVNSAFSGPVSLRKFDLSLFLSLISGHQNSN